MRKERIIAAIFLVSLLSGCFGLFDNSSDTIIGPYNVGWIDVISSRSIDMADKDGGYGGSELIPGYVYAVGHNNRFIIAKQHPLTMNGKQPVDTKHTNYYVIDLSKENYFRKQGVYGPFDEVAFRDTCKKLQVGSIEFNMTYPENP